MKVFLIILAVLVVLFAIILSLSVKLTVVFDDGWTTKVKIVVKEMDVELSKILSVLLFPEKAAQDAAEERAEKKQEKEKAKEEKKADSSKSADSKPADDKANESDDKKDDNADSSDSNDENKEEKPAKPNFIKKLYDEEGVLGIMLLVSNLLQTAGSAVSTLFRGLHIHELYVNMIIGGGDAADIGHMYGTVCGVYYPIKGMLLNGMRIDSYEDNIEADFIAPASEYSFTLVASMNVRLVLRMVLRAGVVFLKNFIKNK